MKLTRRSLLAGVPALLGAPLALTTPFAYAADILTVGLIPSEDSRAMIANSQAMMDMLSRSLNEGTACTREREEYRDRAGRRLLSLWHPGPA